MKPVVLLLILVVGGVVAAFWLSSRPLAPSTPLAASDDLAALSETGADLTDEQAQIRQLEGMVEYLEGQVKVLREENDALLEQLGRVGLPAAPKEKVLRPSAPQTASPSVEPDFVGLGLDLMKLRELNMLPVPTRPVASAEVEQRILDWLRQRHPGDTGLRLGQALHALGWIPEALDPLPLRAQLLRLQLGGWFDEKEGTLLLDEAGSSTGDAFRDALGSAYAQVLREFGGVLFPDANATLTLDERLAREAALAGDAGLTRLLYSLQNPALQTRDSLPPEDPDHPFNQVPLPQFFRQLHFFPFTEGLEFMQGLHAAGGFAQMSACYSRPPRSTAEVLDTSRYLDPNAPLRLEVTLPPALEQMQPVWKDTLGQYAVLTVLRAWNDNERAGLGARGWVGDRLLTFAGASDQERGHAVWQTLWQDAEWAEAFFRAMQNNLRQQYELPTAEEGGESMSFQAGGRQVTLQRNRSGQGVLLIDAAAGEFATALERAARE